MIDKNKEKEAMGAAPPLLRPEKKGFRSFPPIFWLVVIFEFFERGSYYGMMSILSVYLTEHLHFAKESVGLIKGTIQPLLYFLPIISGALADRFGYRRMLMIAFSLLGLGYFLTAQATSYALVFGALVVMGFGAGAFKPIISGTIARVTDEKNSTLGFGVYYWSINLGAFLFPLILVPILKKMDWTYVIIASAIGTATMLIPTLLFYKEPVKKEKNSAKQTNIIQTLANAFEIIYSPIVLLYYSMKSTHIKRITIGIILICLLIFSLTTYLKNPIATEKYPQIGIQSGGGTLIVKVERNMLSEDNFKIKSSPNDPSKIEIIFYKPHLIDKIAPQILQELSDIGIFQTHTLEDLQNFIQLSDQKVELALYRGETGSNNFLIERKTENSFNIIINQNIQFENIKDELVSKLHQNTLLAGITADEITKLNRSSTTRPFFLLYVVGIIFIALGIITFSIHKNKSQQNEITSKPKFLFPFILLSAIGLIVWFIPGLTPLGRIISYVIYITVASLFIIDKDDPHKFIDHAKFLLMIFLYSGFWILYFQMFDSVLWYVQAYVDAATLNVVANKFLGFLGININWFFDIEHVTVINAGTIILLQLIISNIVKKTKALPTMISGIALGTIGMAILAISTDIWVFLIGIILFSIGEMTAHPKFISYVGLIAPTDRKAMYMGYLFLYGVFGSSIGGIMGAKLYVHFVDNLNQPKVLWLVFSAIGVVTILALLMYNKFLAPKEPVAKAEV